MLIGNIDYQIIGKAVIDELGCTVPVIALPMISDNKWIELSKTKGQTECRERLHRQKDGDFGRGN